MFLEAVATAVYLIEAGEVTADGSLAPLLTAEPHRPVHGGTPPALGPRDYWQEARDAMNEAIALSQEDPGAARELLTALTALTRSEVTFQRIRDDLVALSIPDEHLPRTLAESRARETPAGPKVTVTS